ncbi:hypothetical protein [Nocardioides sp. 1609]|uniref:hypothetical protein n=1 Tax=Nocardioides sp. 1609 TaxID=2508327 RepID=UPI0010700CCE|nr:hypothetical protein [Nocardioides sp. 1609]
MSRLPLVALVAVLALGLTACGDDEPTADPTPSDPPTAETTTPSETPSTSETPSQTPSETPSATPSETPTFTSTPDPTPSETVEPSQTTTPPPAPGPDPVPTTYADAQAKLDAAGQEPRTAKRFQTSSGIYCLTQSRFAVGCELPSGGIPDPGYCGTDGPVQSVGRVVFGEGGAPTAECNSDTIREPGAATVADGSVVASPSGAVQCLLEASGVTCIDTVAGSGFFLGSSYSVFGG